jgi:hypothetical protein
MLWMEDGWKLLVVRSKVTEDNLQYLRYSAYGVLLPTYLPATAYPPKEVPISEDCRFLFWVEVNGLMISGNPSLLDTGDLPIGT